MKNPLYRLWLGVIGEATRLRSFCPERRLAGMAIGRRRAMNFAALHRLLHAVKLSCTWAGTHVGDGRTDAAAALMRPTSLPETARLHANLYARIHPERNARSTRQ